MTEIVKKNFKGSPPGRLLTSVKLLFLNNRTLLKFCHDKKDDIIHKAEPNLQITVPGIML